MLTATVKNHIFREENLREARKGGDMHGWDPDKDVLYKLLGRKDSQNKDEMQWQSVVAVLGKAREGGSWLQQQQGGHGSNNQR